MAQIKAEGQPTALAPTATAAQSSSTPEAKQYNYFWKLFDFRNARTFNQVQNEHPYCTNPVKSMNQITLFFHLGDSYFFMNELMKTQATTKEENDLFAIYMNKKRFQEKHYGRLAVGAVFLPYSFAIFSYRGMLWKVGMLYALTCTYEAFYDVGIYAHFFVHGPATMRKIMELDDQSSFAAIQCKLFMRYCAANEIKKATGEMPRRQLKELVLLRSFRNQLRDTGVLWMNSFRRLGLFQRKEE